MRDTLSGLALTLTKYLFDLIYIGSSDYITSCVMYIPKYMQHCKTPRRAEQRTELVSDTDANGENRPSTIPL